MAVLRPEVQDRDLRQLLVRLGRRPVARLLRKGKEEVVTAGGGIRFGVSVFRGRWDEEGRMESIILSF